MQAVIEDSVEKHNKGQKTKKKHLPWAEDSTIAQQEIILQTLDPATNPNSTLTASQFNHQKERLNRERNKWMVKIDYLRRQCYCRACMRLRAIRKRKARLEKKRSYTLNPGRFPDNYVPRLISFECYLERQQEDRESAKQDDPAFIGLIDALDKQNPRLSESPLKDCDMAELLCCLSPTKAKFSDLSIDLNRSINVIKTLMARLYNHGWSVGWDNRQGVAWIDSDGLKRAEEFCEKYLKDKADAAIKDDVDDMAEKREKVGSIHFRIPSREGNFARNIRMKRRLEQ